MNDNSVVVSIVGDASGVAPAVDVAQSSLAGLEPMLAQLNASMAALPAQMKESMTAGATSTHQMSEEMKLLEANTERETLSLRRMGESIQGGVESFKAILGFSLCNSQRPGFLEHREDFSDRPLDGHGGVYGMGHQ